MRSRFPNGVSTLSNATEPTTSNDILGFLFEISELRFQNLISELICLYTTRRDQRLYRYIQIHCSLLTILRQRAAQRFQLFEGISLESAVGIIVNQHRKIVAGISS